MLLGLDNKTAVQTVTANGKGRMHSGTAFELKSDDMGCVLSMRNAPTGDRRPKNAREIAVFVPGMRTPKPLDFGQLFCHDLPRNLVERLSALRRQIVVMAGQTPIFTTRRRGGLTFADLQQALDDYLPVLLGFIGNRKQLQQMVQFSWINQEDNAEDTTMADSLYEVLSVLHLKAMLSLSQANLLLLPKQSPDGSKLRVSEECKRASIDIFLKAAGYLDFAVQHILPRFSFERRKDLPVDLAGGVLRALCLQALGQGVDIQLGMAIDSMEATMAVKRRLACEMVKYFNQAEENIADLPLVKGFGEKHKRFIQWKHLEAKAVAYYFHGLMLDEGNTERSTEMAEAALLTADKFLRESKKACESFHMTDPVSWPSLWGTSKYLVEKAPKDISSRVCIKMDQKKILRVAPTLPDFALSLKPDEYQLPLLDPSWNNNPEP